MLVAHGYELVERAQEDDHDYPDPRAVDLVVPFGSVWSVHDPDLGRHVAAEQRFLRAADHAGVPVFGVCFGAQQLAAALGGSVQPLARPEIGWCTVRTVVPEVVASGPWMQFHFDHLTPPPGARVLAASDACVQAFTVGPHTAVQFHPEVTPAVIDFWLGHGGTEVARAHGVDVDRLRADTVAHTATRRADVERLLAAYLA